MKLIRTENKKCKQIRSKSVYPAPEMGTHALASAERVRHFFERERVRYFSDGELRMSAILELFQFFLCESDRFS